MFYLHFWIILLNFRLRFPNSKRLIPQQIVETINQCRYFPFILILVQFNQVMQIPNQEIKNPQQIIQNSFNPNSNHIKQTTCLQLSSNAYLAFQKNYPKNIFIPLIEYLNQVGLRDKYEQCVGTRQSFQGKNVVSLPQIYVLISQPWFLQKINIQALIASMSNKILMSSKIKKKLFHLMLIKKLFTIPVNECKQFKKLVSKMANQLINLPVQEDPLFNYPSSLIYLLNLFAQGLSREDKGYDNTCYDQSDQSQIKFKSFNYKSRELSSKQQYKLYISRIICALNYFRGDSQELLQMIESIKNKIFESEQRINLKYQFHKNVPCWDSFSIMVVDKCYLARRNHQKLNFSLLSQWVQKFKEWASRRQIINSQPIIIFKPIILVNPQ